MEPITVKSSIDLKTYYKVVLRILFNIKLLLVVVALLIVLSLPVFFEGSFNLAEAWEGVVLVFVFIVVFPLTLWMVCKTGMKKNPLLYEAGICQIDNNTIAYQTQSASASSNWQQIKKAKETKTHYLLFTSYNAFVFLSKDGFSSAQDVERFKEMVKANNVKAWFK